MVRESYLDFEVQGTKLNYRQNCDREFSRWNCLEAIVDLCYKTKMETDF